MANQKKKKKKTTFTLVAGGGRNLVGGGGRNLVGGGGGRGALDRRRQWSASMGLRSGERDVHQVFVHHHHLVLLPAWFGFGFGFEIREKPCIRSIYSFGDSIADTGNLIREGAHGPFSTIAKLPYGRNTFNKSTGRCSDGLLMIVGNGDFKCGVNFAVAGATALDGSFFDSHGIANLFTHSSLSVQLKWFKSHLNSTCFSRAECAKKLRQSLVMMGEIGGNDYNYAFMAGKSIEQVESYVPYVVQTIVNATKHLAAFGSKNQEDYDENNCLKDLNAFSLFHNAKLQEALGDLRKEYHPYVHIKYADYYRAFTYLIENASALGFDESSLQKACCGGGGEYNFDVAKQCGFPGVSACEDPATRISWDGVHMTQRAYR
ncbi:GDSL esterase/lipase At5g03980-like, partial [Asparagus officinalis]|uniref:GDSL esterase/lipase At5g03980-like n=1 Tax=Asparagus officinalis TaxID=4686 RepID=UPI00098E28B2